MGKGLSSIFSNKDTENNVKYMKRYSTSLAIRKMKINNDGIPLPAP